MERENGLGTTLGPKGAERLEREAMAEPAGPPLVDGDRPGSRGAHDALGDLQRVADVGATSAADEFDPAANGGNPNTHGKVRNRPRPGNVGRVLADNFEDPKPRPHRAFQIVLA